MKLLFLDVETGGLDPFTHSLLEVGMVAYADGEVIDRLFLSIKHDLYHIDAEALIYNGINLTDIWRNGISPKEAVSRMIDFIQTNFGPKKKPILVGHNPSLDKFMLIQLFGSVQRDLSNYVSHRMIDTMSLIWTLHMVGQLPIQACSSDGAFKFFNIGVERRHNAIDDCLATITLFERLVAIMREAFSREPVACNRISEGR